MNLQSLKVLLNSHFHKIYPDIAFSNDSFPNKSDKLFPHLSEEEKIIYFKQLSNGDGNAKNDIYKINSSTALAVYYFTLLKSVLGEEIQLLEFENKIGTPLILKKVKVKFPNCNLRSANIDVRLVMNDTLILVESKYLEPYYSTTSLLSDKYLDKSFYGESANVWYKYANLINSSITEYKYYNISQMFKHLLAIYNNKDKEEWRPYANIVLLNTGWKMDENFFSLVETKSRRSASYLRNRQKQIENQKNKGITLLKHIIKDLGWKNCKVEYLHYCDQSMLDRIKNSTCYEDFTKRYLIIDENL